MYPNCPNEHILRSFTVGDLPAREFEIVTEHLAECDRCQELLEHLDEVRDPLVVELAGLTSMGGITTAAMRATFDEGQRLASRLESGPCRLGRFELHARVGEGSFGHVFRARDVELDRTVAVKVQRAGSFASAEDASRFLQEAQSAAQLEHPGIVAVYDTGQTEDGVCYLVTQFIEGETLEQRLATRRPPHRDAARLIAGLADALQHAHDCGVIHRDIKPSNIILDSKGLPHITDFGLAVRTRAARHWTSDGRILGTPAYMSPEQARGEAREVDGRTDVYSLGVVLYELLTGERPFQGNRRLLVLQVLEDDPRPPRMLDEDVPRDLETICLKAMAKPPQRRYQTAGEMADDLRRFLRGEPIQARPSGHFERLYRWCRRYPVAAGLLLAVSLGSAFSFWYFSRLSRYFVEATALDSARMEVGMLEDIYNFYSSHVVNTLDWDKVHVSHEYKGKNDTIPLPATMLIDVGEYISQNYSGMEVRLYSNHPFRENCGPRDDFERRAIADLNSCCSAEQNMDRKAAEYHEFTEKEGRPVVRYARAQVMKASCVKCHNSDRSSPKRDWKEGDLAGVLSITRPLDQDIQRTRSALQGAFVLVGGVGATLFGASLAYLFVSRSKKHSQETARDTANRHPFSELEKKEGV